MSEVARHLGKIAASQERRRQAAKRNARITASKNAIEALEVKVPEAQLESLRSQYLTLKLTRYIPASASPSMAVALYAAQSAGAFVDNFCI